MICDSPAMIVPRAQKALRCPVHPHVELLRSSAHEFACSACGHAYPVQDGIAKLLPPDFDYPADFRVKESAQWDAQATDYETHRLNDLIYDACVEATASGLAPRAGELVLDAACGVGLPLRRYWHSGVETVALDLSEVSLRLCRQHAPSANVLYVQGDLTRLPFDDEAFDAVLCANALQHVPTDELRRRCIGEFARVTRAGGRAVITAHNFCVPKQRHGWKKISINPSEENGIGYQYIYRFDADEFRELLARDFEIVSLFGAGMPLWYRWKLAPISHLLERVLRRMPMSKRYGHMLVAICRR